MSHRALGRMLTAAGTIAGLGLAASPSLAFRPFDGTDATVAAPQSIETELGPLAYVREGHQRILILPELVLNYGAGSGWEFVIEGRRYLRMTDEQPTPSPRYDDFDLSVKRMIRVGVLQEKKGPSIATEEALLLPTSDEKGTGFRGSLIVSEHFRWMGIHLNAAISRTRAHETGRFGSAIFEIFDRLTIHPLAELSLERDGEATSTKGLLVGALWETRERLNMDFAVRTSYADEHDAEVIAGITFGKHIPHGPTMP